MKYHIQALAVLICLPLVFSSCGYNKLTELESAVEGQWGTVESAYQRRADLVPIIKATMPGVDMANLESLAKEAAEVSIDYDELDSKAFIEFDKSQKALLNGFETVFNQATNNPESVNQQAFDDAKTLFSGNENRIHTERRKFNLAVADYNSYRNQMPQKFTARITGFKDHSPFDSNAN